jgi:hypothetical protein
VRIKLSTLSCGVALSAAAAFLVASATASRVQAASSHHCRNEQALYASKSVVIARETTETSDIYVTCWRATNKHRVVAKFPAERHELVAFRIRGAWVVWRYRITAASGQHDRMGSLNARTGRRGPTVRVVASETLAPLTRIDGPVAQDVSDGGAMYVFIAANGWYAWPVFGQLSDTESGQQATALYRPDGKGGDVRIDVAPGFDTLAPITISNSTLRWANNGQPKHLHLGPPTHP